MSGWTNERVALLQELNDLGSAAWMAAEINSRTGSAFTRNAVIGKMMRAGLIKVLMPGCYSRPRKTGPDHRFFPVADRPKQPDHLGLSLSALKNDFSQCRFIHGDNETAPYTFCAQPVTDDSTYCTFHHAVCCQPFQKKQVAA